MVRKKKLPVVDYVFVSAKKEPEPISSRKIIKSFKNGKTIVTHVIDPNYERLLIGGRYNVGID